MSQSDQIFTDFTQDFALCERLSVATSYSSKRRSTWFSDRRRSSVTSTSSSSNQDILNDIHDLSILEKERNDDEVDMNNYRLKVKNLLTNLLLKLEENVEYQCTLEEELLRLEHVVRSMLNCFSIVAIYIALFQKEAQNSLLRKQIDRTNRKLEEMVKDKERIKHARKVELSILSEYSKKLSKSIEDLNSNFEVEETDDDNQDVFVEIEDQTSLDNNISLMGNNSSEAKEICSDSPYVNGMENRLGNMSR